MSEQYKNNAATTLAAAITTTSQSTITVTSATGFPTTGNFRILIMGELMLVTAISGGTSWTVTRGIEGTQTITAAIGAAVDHVVTAGALTQIRGEVCTVGTYANLPSSPTTGDLYVPTDSFYDIIRYNGSSWDHFRNGRQLTPPINANYTWDNTGNGTVTATYGGVVGFSSQSIGGQLQVRYKTAPSTPYTVTTAFLPHYTATNYNQVGIGFRDSTGKISLFALAYNNGLIVRRTKWNSSTSFNSEYGSITIPAMLLHGPIVWLQMVHDGTNLLYNMSSNGINWTLVGSVSKTDFVNCSGTHQIFFGWGDANADVGMTLLHWKET